MGDPFYWIISLSALFSRRIPVVTSGRHPFDDCTISHCMDTPHVNTASHSPAEGYIVL